MLLRICFIKSGERPLHFSVNTLLRNLFALGAGVTMLSLLTYEWFVYFHCNYPHNFVIKVAIPNVVDRYLKSFIQFAISEAFLRLQVMLLKLPSESFLSHAAHISFILGTNIKVESEEKHFPFLL